MKIYFLEHISWPLQWIESQCFLFVRIFYVIGFQNFLRTRKRRKHVFAKYVLSLLNFNQSIKKMNLRLTGKFGNLISTYYLEKPWVGVLCGSNMLSVLAPTMEPRMESCKKDVCTFFFRFLSLLLTLFPRYRHFFNLISIGRFQAKYWFLPPLKLPTFFMDGHKALSKQATFPSVLYLEHEQPRFLYSSSLLCKYGKK